MDLEQEYRDLIMSLKSHPETLQTIVNVIDFKKKKLLKAIESSKDRDEVWDNKTKLTAVEDLKREIITHSK